MTLYDDTLELLQELIRNACVNDLTPDSGFEVRNADTLENFFAGEDVSIERFESHPGRVSIVVTVPGDPAKEPLTPYGAYRCRARRRTQVDQTTLRGPH